MKMEYDFQRERIRVNEGPTGSAHAYLVSYNKVKLLPHYKEGNDVDMFLQSFKTLYRTYNWWEEAWAAQFSPCAMGKPWRPVPGWLIMTALTIKLCTEPSWEGIGLTPETCRVTPGSPRKGSDNSFPELAVEMTNLFNRWIEGEKVCGAFFGVFFCVSKMMKLSWAAASRRCSEGFGSPLDWKPSIKIFSLLIKAMFWKVMGILPPSTKMCPFFQKQPEIVHNFQNFISHNLLFQEHNNLNLVIFHMQRPQICHMMEEISPCT